MEQKQEQMPSLLTNTGTLGYSNIGNPETAATHTAQAANGTSSSLTAAQDKDLLGRLQLKAIDVCPCGLWESWSSESAGL